MKTRIKPQQADSLVALALELLAQEVTKTLPASERPAELQAALSLAFEALGIEAIATRKERGA